MERKLTGYAGFKPLQEELAALKAENKELKDALKIAHSSQSVYEEIDNYRSMLHKVEKDNEIIETQNSILSSEAKEFKLENERLQRESKWNLEQCVKLQQENGQLKVESTIYFNERNEAWKENDRLKELLLESTLRCQLALPETDKQKIWFDESTDVTKSDFIIRLYKANNIGNPPKHSPE